MKPIFDIWFAQSKPTPSEETIDTVGSTIPNSVETPDSVELSSLSDEIQSILHQLILDLQSQSIDTGYGKIALTTMTDAETNQRLFNMVGDGLHTTAEHVGMEKAIVTAIADRSFPIQSMDIPTMMTQSYRQAIIARATHLISDPVKSLKWKRSINLEKLHRLSGKLRFMTIESVTFGSTGTFFGLTSEQPGLYLELTTGDVVQYILLMPNAPQPILILTGNIFTEAVLRKTLSQQGLLGYLVLIECTGQLASKLLNLDTYWVSMENDTAPSGRKYRVKYHG